MAMILPLLVLLLFGTIEASWAFAQANDVRHGAREGARLAAVNHGDVAAIGAAVCDRMEVADGDVSVTLSPSAGDGSRNSSGRVSVSMPFSGLSGALDQFLGGTSLNSDIVFIVEIPKSTAVHWWAGGTYEC